MLRLYVLVLQHNLAIQHNSSLLHYCWCSQVFKYYETVLMLCVCYVGVNGGGLSDTKGMTNRRCSTIEC